MNDSIILNTHRSFKSEITLGHGLFLNTLKAASKEAVWFYDPKLPKPVLNSLFDQVDKKLLYPVEGLETGKSLRNLEPMIAFLDQLDITMTTPLYACGGGTLTDAVAFVASIYLRGLHLTLIPTTLLAMVDAGIGGKTAFNSTFKNRIGSFYPAHQIIIDFDFLALMPLALIEDGMVEVIKIALLFDPNWVEALEAKTISLEASIKKAITHKCQVVEQDLSDQHTRKLLNLGHTVGHALEAFHEFKYSHGRCVANGLLIEHHDHALHSKIQQLLEAYTDFKKMSFDVDALIPYILKDKKRHDQTIDFIFLKAIGNATIKAMTIKELTPFLRAAQRKDMS